MKDIEEFRPENIKSKKFRNLRSERLLLQKDRISNSIICHDCKWSPPRQKAKWFDYYLVPINYIRGLKAEDYLIDNVKIICKKCYNKR